jgi:hypothetical protein
MSSEKSVASGGLTPALSPLAIMEVLIRELPQCVVRTRHFMFTE